MKQINFGKLFKIGGIQLVAIVILFYILNYILKLEIFSKISQTQTFLLLILIVIVLGILSYLALTTNQTKEVQQEQNSNKVSSDIEVLDEISKIRTKVSEIFSSKEKTELIQTFIKTNALPPVLDKARDFYNIYKTKQGSLGIKLKRLICISHPKEIYFTNESLRLADNMGNYFKVSLFYLDEKEASPLNTFPNFTLDNNNVLISFPIEQEINSRQLSFPLFSENNSIESSGIFVKNEQFNISTKKYLNILSEQIEQTQEKDNWKIFENAKVSLWQSKPLEYLDSIARDICKEILKTSIIEKSIQYLGIVGSLVELLEREIELIPNDIDIIVCVDSISVEKYKTIESIVKNVLEAYSSPEITFYSLFSATPSKIEFCLDNKRFPVQVLIYNRTTINQLSPFVASQRLKTHISYKGKIEDFILTKSFSINDVLVKTFGIDSSLKSISEKPYSIFSESWIIEGDNIFYKVNHEKIFDEKCKFSFCKYSIKWNTKNLIDASDTIIPKGISNISEKINWIFTQANVNDETKKIVKNIMLNNDINGLEINHFEKCTIDYLNKLRQLIKNN